MEIKKFKKVLVANRGEIAIRVFRALKELDIRSVAIYSQKDKKSLFRTKADESYEIGKNKSPVGAYLDINEIIKLAKKKNVDAIHPGYGFLSENSEFAKKCEENGIVFIGPNYDIIDKLGDKVNSKIIAKNANVPTIQGDKVKVTKENIYEVANDIGFPIILKAAMGGGGRGMRIVNKEEDLMDLFLQAKKEAKSAFGNDHIFAEKYIKNAKHIEVQIMADKYNNLVHLFERDCSIQRRHQKIIEFAPSLFLTKEKREEICNDAIKIGKYVNYQSLGTVEFLVDENMNHYFIEVNPRIQVEHTVTEEITGIDLVQSQILIAQGYSLDSEEINIKSQKDIEKHGYALQLRITTEDPKNNFAPDNGKIDVYRTASGSGIRLDGGNGFTGSIITPYYDSLLVKITSRARTFQDAIRKSKRSIKELKISGVKTNAEFLLNILNTKEFQEGKCTTNFIETHKELFNIKKSSDKELKILNYIGDIIVNKNKKNKENKLNNVDLDIIYHKPRLPENLKGTKQILEEKGVKGVIDYIKNTNKLLLTETSLRDAHQSLFATRMRTYDMLKACKSIALYEKDLFSLEMWGGATFDVAYRFLKESPWERLREIRKRIPNILFQMLLRGENLVGYKNYPDNVVKNFIEQSAKNGIDIFRIFDSLNYLDAIIPSINYVKETGKIAEGTMCYTGNILDSSKTKYTLEYYVNLGKKIQEAGADILGIKDMSGLLRPEAAYKLISTLKENIDIPIHLHTHDTTGTGVATILAASNAGCDIVDGAISSLSGLTSQPSLNSIVAALENTKRDTGFNLEEMENLSEYFGSIRPIYECFSSDLKTSTTDIYKYEIPGGQYSNLKPQVESFGLADKFKEVKEKYKEVNEMLGDIIKVTPSSKMVGDLAIFMVQNSLTKENIYEKGKDLTYPDSAVAYFSGMMGQPAFGFNEKLQKIVLKGKKPITVLPSTLLKPVDFNKIEEILKTQYKLENPSMEEKLSYALYDKVFLDFLKHREEFTDLSHMPSDVFFHGLKQGETREIEIEEGKVLIVTLLNILDTNKDGFVTLTFEVNGNRRDVLIKDDDFFKDNHLKKNLRLFANENDETEIGASIPGNISKINVKENDKVKKGDTLIMLEAMKMQINISATVDGTIDKIFVKEGDLVKSNELLIKLK